LFHGVHDHDSAHPPPVVVVVVGVPDPLPLLPLPPEPQMPEVHGPGGGEVSFDAHPAATASAIPAIPASTRLMAHLQRKSD
jgi:hypothetical protein